MDIGNIELIFNNENINIKYNIDNYKQCKLSFIYKETPVKLNINTWSNYGFTVFVTVYLQQLGLSNKELYDRGIFSSEETSSERCKTISDFHCNLIIIEAIRDVFYYMEILLENKDKELLEYCVWYKNTYKFPRKYFEFIQLVGCLCILQTEDLFIDKKYDVIPFIKINGQN